MFVLFFFFCFSRSTLFLPRQHNTLASHHFFCILICFTLPSREKMPTVFSRLSTYVTPSWLLLLACSYLCLRLLRSWIQGAQARAKLKEVQETKRKERGREFQIVEEKLRESEKERKGKEEGIALASATSLVQRLRNGTLSSRLVLHSLLSRLLSAQRQFNCISEPRFALAMEEAEQADQHLSSSGTPLGRLHGLPISLKDSVNLIGIDTTLGLARFVNQPATDDALIVKLLRKQGAIFYCKSNIPQTLLSFECSNPVYGRTLSPFNKNLTPGGSSGGESVLLSCGASVLGIGTDIGGSVRIPAHFSGNTALKPTGRRLSLQGFRPAVPGQEAIPAVAGPMAQSVEDLVLVLRELWVKEAWERDSDLVPLPFDEKEVMNQGKLKIGYYVDDGFLAASPACSRAVLQTVDALRKQGHSVTPFAPPRLVDAIALYYSLITSDNCTTLSNQLNGEIWEDYSTRLISGVRLPTAVKQLVALLLEKVLKDKKAATITKSSREKTTAEVWSLQYERKKLRQEFFDAWTSAGDFDVLLCPVHVLPAVPHKTFKNISFTCSFTLVFNLLDLPAGVLPVTAVDKHTDAYSTPATGVLEKAARACYQLEEQHGCPIGVQVVGKPFKDETVLRAMRVIESAMKFAPRPKWNP